MRFRSFLFALGVVLGVLLIPNSVRASAADDIAAKTHQIEEIQRQIAELERQAGEVGAQKKTLEAEIGRLNGNISRINLEIRSLTTSIERTGLEINETRTAITEAERQMNLHQEALAVYLRDLDAVDRESLVGMLLKHQTLSDFFDFVHSVQRAQDNVRITIQTLNDDRTQLDSHQSDLEDKKSELERMRLLQQVQQRDLASAKSTKDTVLKETKGQENKYQQLIKDSKTNLKRLQEQIYYLQQNGINAQDAVTYAKLAAVGAGIRPAFLLALLEVESRLGLNVGTGNWMDDMVLCYTRLAGIAKTQDRKSYYLKRAETEKNAFIKITNALGVDPNTQKVSKEPSYGCGGAMGPAQFIPSTWIAYAPEVARLTGRVATNPWNTEDAFTAAAIKLARGGASSQTRAGELAAAKAYISGNPNCTQAICTSYSNTILTKAAAIERDL